MELLVIGILVFIVVIILSFVKLADSTNNIIKSCNQLKRSETELYHTKMQYDHNKQIKKLKK